jgi:hypothetical protein
MNPVVTIAVIFTLVLFMGLCVAMSLVDFLPDDLHGSEGLRRGGATGRGQPG